MYKRQLLQCVCISEVILLGRACPKPVSYTHLVVKVTLNGRSAALVQLLAANTFLLHYGVYLWLVALGTAIIWGLSFLMQHWLERVITRPVEAVSYTHLR